MFLFFGWVSRMEGNLLLLVGPLVTLQDVIYQHNFVDIQGSHPTWKTLKTWNFVIFFSRPGRCLEFTQKVVKTWNFNLKPGKT